MKKVALIFFGDLSGSNGFGHLNYLIARHFLKKKMVRQIFCFSFDIHVDDYDIDKLKIFQFKSSLLSKLNTLITWFLPKIVGQRLYLKYVDRLVTEVLFDIFCFFRLQTSRDLIVLDFKSISILTQSKTKWDGGQFFCFAPNCHPVEEHNKIVEFCHNFNLREYSPYANFLRRKIYKWYIENSTKVIPLLPSNYVINTYLKNGLDNNKIIRLAGPWGIDQVFFQEKCKETEKTIFLAISGGTHIKGMALLLKAWISLQPQDAELWIIGWLGGETPFSETQSVKYIPYSHCIWEYYKRADIFVCPSVIDLGPRSVFEAMACGLVVVVSDQCGASQYITSECGFIFTFGSVSDLQRNIQQCLDNKSALPSMGSAARHLVKSFNMQSYLDSIVLLCE